MVPCVTLWRFVYRDFRVCVSCMIVGTYRLVVR